MRIRKTEGLSALPPAVRQQPKHARAAGVVLDCVLLAALLGGFIGAVLDTYRLTAFPLPLYGAGIASAVAVRLCLKWKRAGLIFGIVLCGVWGWFLFTFFSQITAGAVQFLNEVLGGLARESSNSLQFYPWTLPETAESPQWLETLFLLAVLPVLSALLALCVWQKRTILAGLLLVVWMVPALYFTILPPMWAVAVVLAALAALSAVHTAAGRHALSGLQAPAKYGVFSFVAVLLCAAVLLFSLPPAAYTRGETLEHVRAVMEGFLDAAGPNRRRTGLANTDGPVNMQNASGVSFSGRTVLRVQGPAGEPLYLKSYVGAAYEASTWTPPDGSVFETFLEGQAVQDALNPQLFPARFEDLSDQNNMDFAPEQENRLETLSVENVGANPRCLYVPYGLTALPENAVFDGDARAVFTNFFGETSYAVPFTLCRDDSAGTTWMESGGLTAEWPVYYPSESFSLLFRGPANTQQIYSIINAMGQSLLEDGAGIFNYSLMARAIDEMTRYGWMNTNHTDEERLALRFLSAWTNQQQRERAVSTFSVESLNAYYEGLYTAPLAPITAEGVEGAPLDLSAFDAETAAYWDYEAAYRAAIYEPYTQVPDALRQVLETWLSEQGFERGDVYTATDSMDTIARAIADALAETCTYTLSPGAPPEGVDFIDYFLNENHKGYCVHFATAETLLLRTLGIPARYAEGYYLPATLLTEGAFCDVADSRAHAWVEIYSPGLGWVPFEATPGYSAVTTPDNVAQSTLDDSTSSAAASSSEAPASSAASQAETESAPASQAASASSGTASAAPAAPGQAIPEDGVRNVLSLLAFFGLLAAVVFGRHLFVQRRREAAFRPDTNAAVVAMFAYLKRLESHGVELPPEAVRLGEKARFSQHALTADECARMREFAAGTSRAFFARQPNAMARFSVCYLQNLCYRPKRRKERK